MQQRFKGEAGMGGRGKNRPLEAHNKQNRTSKATGIAPARRTKASTKPKNNQGRNQKEWSAAKKMAARY
jgi:hypothetical protein